MEQTLQQDPSIKELLQILQDVKMEVPANELLGLLKYVDSLERQMSQVVGELQGVKNQLHDLQERKSPLVKAYADVTQKLEMKIKETGVQISAVKNTLLEQVKKAVRNFKQHGLSGLHKALDFLQVKKGLLAIRDSLNQSIVDTHKSIAKIDTISREYHQVGSHLKNIGNAVMNKEPVEQSLKENGKLSAFIKAPFRINLRRLNSSRHTIDNALSLVEKLEHSVQNNVKEKPSILANLKKTAQANQNDKAAALVKPKKQEASL